MQYQVADTRKSSSLLKKYLSTKYGVKFAVKTDKYSMGSSLNIDWVLGPSSKVIDGEVSRLQDGDFNGMIDMYEYRDSAETGMVIDGWRIETQKYVFTRQSIPSDIFFKIAQKMSQKFSFGSGDYVLPVLETESQLNESFKIRFGNAWNWREMVSQDWEVRNFVTDDPTKIEIVDVEFDDSPLRRLVVVYTFEGQTYRTTDLTVQEPVVEKEKVINVNDVRLIDYSEKAIAVIGKTYEIKDDLNALGGRFNKFLTVDGKQVAGWIFSKSKQDEVSNLLIEYSKK